MSHLTNEETFKQFAKRYALQLNFEQSTIERVVKDIDTLRPFGLNPKNPVPPEKHDDVKWYVEEKGIWSQADISITQEDKKALYKLQHEQGASKEEVSALRTELANTSAAREEALRNKIREENVPT